MIPPVLFVAIQTGSRANGGIESLTRVALAARRIRPMLLTNLETAHTARWRQAGLDVHVVPLGEALGHGAMRRPLAHVSAYMRYDSAIRSLMRQSGARVIHANDPLAMQMSVAPARRGAARLVLQLRDTLSPARRPPRVRYRLLFGLCDHALFLSREMQAHWSKLAPGLERKSGVTYSVVETSGAHALPAQLMVLVAGKICAKKGQLDFLRHVAPRLAEAGVRTVLAGDYAPDTDPYAAACAAAAAPLRAAVSITGYRSDLPALIQAATVVAVSSTHEGLVRAMIEAMAAGRPVVSFDVCSAREILEVAAPRAGRVVTAGDHSAMAEAILVYCQNRSAAEIAGRAGQAAARRLFTADSVAAAHEAVYLRLAEAA
jgi:glycosyltransferase involved in cell wall biosynthesis